MQEDTKWHWAEGLKYAIEAMKTLLIINGAAAVSILTFIGNTKAHSGALILSMICFAVGASTSAIIQASAYLAQLHYGNASTEQNVSDRWRHAQTLHNLTYFFAISGFVLFLSGVGFAAYGLYSL